MVRTSQAKKTGIAEGLVDLLPRPLFLLPHLRSVDCSQIVQGVDLEGRRQKGLLASKKEKKKEEDRFEAIYRPHCPLKRHGHSSMYSSTRSKADRGRWMETMADLHCWSLNLVHPPSPNLLDLFPLLLDDTKKRKAMKVGRSEQQVNASFLLRGS